MGVPADLREGQQFEVDLTWPDADDDDSRPLAAALLVSDGGFRVVVEQNSHLVQVARWIPFRGPKVFQIPLTFLCAARGMLVSQKDLRWLNLEAPIPRLRIMPWVPAEFWVDLEFRSHGEACNARRLLARLWEPR